MKIKEDIQRYYDLWFSMESLYGTWAKNHGLTSNAVFVLTTIYDHPDTCTQQLICKKNQLPKQTVNSILADFEAKGYIKKTPDQKDRRSKIVLFTDAGKVYADKILGEIYEIEATALTNMPSDERADMLDYWEKFLTLLQKIFHEKENE